MGAHAIGAFGFIRWEGPRPQFVNQHSIEFAKPGQNGISAQLLGIYGDPFQARLTAVFANEVAARASESTYRTLIGAAPQVLIYDGTNYSTGYSHLYFVKHCRAVEAKAHPRLIGPTYDYPGGWRVVSEWTLIPVA